MNSNKEHWILCPACGSKTRARLLPDTVSVGSFHSVLKNSGYILMSSSSEAHTKCSLLLSSIKLSLIGAKASGTFI
ncbi:cysteine-rich KTR domain-containing protein [Gemmiger sp.]|uniref:cysteine-rich KTR domain-containing protein n=1 Tax=Gemmiger sp. TaxID=2049027 RepID=UPI0034250A9E